MSWSQRRNISKLQCLRSQIFHMLERLWASVDIGREVNCQVSIHKFKPEIQNALNWTFWNISKTLEHLECFKSMYLFYVCEGFACKRVCEPWSEIPWEWICGWVWTALLVLGNDLGSSAMQDMLLPTEVSLQPHLGLFKIRAAQPVTIIIVNGMYWRPGMSWASCIQ